MSVDTTSSKYTFVENVKLINMRLMSQGNLHEVISEAAKKGYRPNIGDYPMIYTFTLPHSIIDSIKLQLCEQGLSLNSIVKVYDTKKLDGTKILNHGYEIEVLNDMHISVNDGNTLVLKKNIYSMLDIIGIDALCSTTCTVMFKDIKLLQKSDDETVYVTWTNMYIMNMIDVTMTELLKTEDTESAIECLPNDMK